jgi:hypothetical protein
MAKSRMTELRRNTMQQQPNQSFTLTDLTGSDIEAIMNGMNELPSKVTRTVMNKIEGQIVQQIIAAQQPPAPPEEGKSDDQKGE